MNIKRAQDLIDVVVFVVMTAGWFSFAGWPVLFIALGAAILIIIHRYLRSAESVTDDEVMNAMAMAFSISDDGRPIQRLHLGTSDVRGILTELHCHGLTITRSEIVQDYPAPGSIGHYHKVLESQINQT